MTQRLFFFLLIPALLATGCSPPTEGEVSGTVTVNGEPAKMGSITFIPVDGMSSTAGTSITDGQYSAMVPFGKMKVQIRVSKIVGEQKLYNTPDSPVQPVYAEVLPPKYNDETELEVEVEPGVNEQNFDLKTR